ncbi:MAG: hypothetical protein K9K67_06065 [Bacteriovoracaceae bacterium]|nr:hypothetical protein [Bacteriovoracaceae bacterium]
MFISKHRIEIHLGTNIAAILIVLSCLLGCSAKESIEPAWAPESIDSQLSEKPLQVSIPIDPVDVEDFGEDFGEVDVLGPLFQELAGVFANVVLGEEDGQRIVIDPVIYFAPELDQIDDWSIISKLDIKNISLKVVEAIDWEFANFDFIKELRVFIDFTLPSDGQTDRQGQGVLIASYDKEIDRESLGGLGRELELKVQDVNWRDILKTQRTFVIYTEIVVERVPGTKMKIGGNLGVSLGLKLGR